ncbi:TPA: DNA-binding response regulator [bacterium]|nr:DNA-binding response regulator [bacterium]
MKREKILVVEDDYPILTGLIDLLNIEGFEVSSARDGLEALRLYRQEKPNLILLDIMIPEKSGYDVCREIRRKDLTTPILMLTAKGQEIDKVVGLEIGADDYIVKPFGVKELLARIRAALRRSNARTQREEDDRPIVFGNIHINPKTLRGQKGDEEFLVTPREVQLLQLFIQHDGEVVHRFTLLDEIWGLKYEGTTRTLDQHIAKLRQKIEENPAHPRYITTIHGVGYRFTSNPE